MLAELLGIRERDRRDTGVAFVTLVAILMAHSILETARDALFLSKLAPEQLPLAYIAIAVFALVVSKLNQRATAVLPRRALLSASLMIGGIVTAAFHQLITTRTGLALGALYVWTGMLATVVVVQFWLQLGDVLDVGQAKRVFSVVAAGGLVGATAGSALAGALLTVVQADELLLVAGAIFLVAGLLPAGFSSAAPPEVAPRGRRAGTADVSEIASDPYLRRLFVMVLVGAVLVTGIDFLFKAKVVAEAENQGWELGAFFARYYAVVNGISLLVQLFLAPRILSAVGVNRALLVMPAIMLTGAAGFSLTLGLAPALILKGTDGTLRHSIHRTASEILYLPLARPVRERFKAFAETVGQRGGQALASVAILGVTTLTPDARPIAFGLTALALLWVATMVGMQPHYLERFRRQLREGMLDTHVDIPDLDLASFETLVSALSSEDDQEVIAALDMFEIYGKSELVPALILYHPSREVVMRAFELFAQSDRADVQRLTGRLLKHDDEVVRAAALRTLASAQPDEALIRRSLDDPSPGVRCTALLALVSAGFIDDDRADEELVAVFDGTLEEQRALARSLRYLDSERFGWVASRLSDSTDPEVQAEVARALALDPSPADIPVLIPLLEGRSSRDQARRALTRLGDVALDELVASLADTSLPPGLRLHLPRTISRFDGARPIRELIEALLRERDDRVVFKILRGLTKLRADHPTVPVDRTRILDLAHATLEQAVRFLHWRLVVGRVVARQQQAMTPAAELLVAFLDERHQENLSRTFRLLHVLEPLQDFRVIYGGLRRGDEKAHATSIELIQHVVPESLREGVLALVSDDSPRKRLRAARPFFDPPSREAIDQVLAKLRENEDDPDTLGELARLYAGTLRDMLTDPSDALRSIVGYHVAELGIDELMGMVEEAARTSDPLGQVASRAPTRLRLIPEVVRAG